MLVTIPFSELQGNKIKGLVNGKKITAVPLVNVTSAELSEVALYPERYKGVIFNYIGDMQQAQSLYVEKKDFEIICIYNPTTLEEVPQLLHYVPNYMTCVIQLPQEFSDMRILKSYCSVHPNIRFVGGHLLQIEGVRIGYVDNTFISKKSNGLSVVTNGLDGLYMVYDYTQIEELDFIKYKEKTAKVREPKPPKEKKPKEKVDKPKTPKEPKPKKQKYLTGILFS